MEPQDTITIAPSVMLTIARHAAEQVRGIARMGQIPVAAGRLFSGNPMGNGIVLEINGDTVQADIYLLVRPGTNMLEASRAVQQAVKRALEDLVGMKVSTVNVHVEDVDYTTEPA